MDPNKEGCSVQNPKTGKHLYLHKKERNSMSLYYFSFDVLDIESLPEGCEIRFSARSGHPYIIKKGSRRYETQSANYW